MGVGIGPCGGTERLSRELARRPLPSVKTWGGCFRYAGVSRPVDRCEGRQHDVRRLAGSTGLPVSRNGVPPHACQNSSRPRHRHRRSPGKPPPSPRGRHQLCPCRDSHRHLGDCRSLAQPPISIGLKSDGILKFAAHDRATGFGSRVSMMDADAAGNECSPEQRHRGRMQVGNPAVRILGRP